MPKPGHQLEWEVWRWPKSIGEGATVMARLYVAGQGNGYKVGVEARISDAELERYGPMFVDLKVNEMIVEFKELLYRHACDEDTMFSVHVARDAARRAEERAHAAEEKADRLQRWASRIENLRDAMERNDAECDEDAERNE